MKIVAIDAGNTHLRIAKIDTDSLKNDIEIIHSNYEKIIDVIDGINEEKLFISIASVVPKVKDLYVKLRKNYENTYLCDRESIVSLSINYSQTLGIDRIVDAVAALTLFPNRDLIVIDSGTATTIDCVNSKREFLGGFILPGIKITSEAIHEKTAVLPFCNPYELNFCELPQDTFAAVSSGLIADCAGGIEYVIDICAKKLSDPLILGCGGGWKIIKDFVRKETLTIPQLTLIGTAIVGENYFHRKLSK